MGMDVAARRPELMPAGMPDIDEINVEINAMRAALERQHVKVVFCHGSMVPSKVVMRCDGTVKLIDFELGGPSYRGFDLMKLFRTAGQSSEECIEYFLSVYAGAVGEVIGEKQCKEDVVALMKEVRMFEPLTWLEAALFFIVMPQFKPQGSEKWNELAIHRWRKFQETKHLLA